jgi:hypothetical protein
MQSLSTQHQSGVVFSQTLVCCLLDTIRRRIPVSTTCGVRTAQNPPPRRSTTSQPAVALAPLNCGAVPSFPSQSIGLSERTRAAHHATSGCLSACSRCSLPNGHRLPPRRAARPRPVAPRPRLCRRRGRRPVRW